MTTLFDHLLTRRSVAPAMLQEPGPDEATLRMILTAACRVPDHGKLAPWRILLFRGIARSKMGDILAETYARANPDASEKQIEFERERLTRAPVVACVISSPKESPKVPEWEQLLSAGAVCLNMLHAVRAAGFGASWLTEWYAYDKAVGAALGLSEKERVAGFMFIGTAPSVPPDRPRPELGDIAHDWSPPGEDG